MCLVIALISFAIAYNFYDPSNLTATAISLLSGLFFLGLMIRNILKTKQQRTQNKREG